MNTLSRGVWSGIMATSAMTFFLFAAHKRLRGAGRRPLPPAALSNELQEQVAGVPDASRPTGRENRALLAHLGFGSSMGLAYSLLSTALKRRNPFLGAGFGMLVWAASYLGWIPALRLSPAAPKAPRGENLMMVLGHLVFGLALSYADKELAQRGRELLDGKRGAGRAA